jgi:hypothetical protein
MVSRLSKKRQFGSGAEKQDVNQAGSSRLTITQLGKFCGGRDISSSYEPIPEY